MSSAPSKPTIVIRQVPRSDASSLSQATSVLKIISSKPDGQQIVTTKPIILTTTNSDKTFSKAELSALDSTRGMLSGSKHFVKFVVRPSSPAVVSESRSRPTIVLNDVKPPGLSRSYTDSALLKSRVQTDIQKREKSQVKAGVASKPGAMPKPGVISRPTVMSHSMSSADLMKNGSNVIKGTSYQMVKNNDPPGKLKPFLPSTSQVCYWIPKIQVKYFWKPYLTEFLSLHHQLRASRALLLFNDVPLRTRRPLSLYNVYDVSALLVTLTQMCYPPASTYYAVKWHIAPCFICVPKWCHTWCWKWYSKMASWI